MTSLHNSYEKRKYLTPEERERFKEKALQADQDTRTFCLLLYYTGVRISEGLNVLVAHIDFPCQCVVIRSLKKRKLSYRALPLPTHFLEELNNSYHIKKRQALKLGRRENIWNWSRNTAYLKIKSVLQKANINGVYATPKGLRHGFAINCLMKNIPLPYISKWMGHSSLRVTAMYANAIGKEERTIVARLWNE